MTLCPPSTATTGRPGSGTATLTAGHPALESFHNSDSLPWALMLCRPDGVIVEANRAASERLGAEVGARLRQAICSPDHLDDALHQAASGVETHLHVTVARGWPGVMYLGPSGVHGHVACAVVPRVADPGADQIARAHENRFRVLCEHAPAGILCAEGGMRVDYANERCAEVFGVPPEDLWGFGWLDGLEGADCVEAALSAVERAVAGEAVGPIPLVISRPDGTTRHVEARFASTGRGTGGFVATVEDVTDNRTLAEHLERQAHHDELTGLGNRRLMVDAVDSAIEAIATGKLTAGALVFIDLDNFKYVNDTLGHGAGDKLLVEVAGRISSSVRDSDIVTRFGGDEFVVLLTGDGEGFVEVAERIVERVGAPYLIDGHPAMVTASAGVVHLVGHGDAETVLRDADVAMYQAKRAGKNRATVFTEGARDLAQAHLQVVGRLRDTLQRHPEHLNVLYQPICTLDGKVVGVEALARWTDPELGQVPADVFIGAAERSGLASELGALIRERAIRDAAAWRKAGWDGYLSVNVSAAELADQRLPHQLVGQLLAAGLASRSLQVEVTETAMVSDIEGARRILEAITSFGVSVAIDDFGTGHSSLAYLKRFPVSCLKVDREFIDGVAEGEDRAICEAIVALARAFELTVVAEGVETDEQLAALIDCGVDAAQGWRFSPPVSATEFAELCELGAAPEDC